MAHFQIEKLKLNHISEVKQSEIKTKPKENTTPRQKKKKDDNTEFDFSLHMKTSADLFPCPEVGCTAMFLKHGYLMRHVDRGIHRFDTNVLPRQDLSKIKYAMKVHMPTHTVTPATRVDSHNIHKYSFKTGFALPKKRECKRFSDKQKQFLDDLFWKGENTDNGKVRPHDASLLMRQSPEFKLEDYLNEDQIKGYFSRLTQKNKGKLDSTIMKGKSVNFIN